MSSKLYSIIAKVMKIPIDSITDQSTPQSIPNWTSFVGYVLLNELETQFNVKFTIDEVIDVKNISDIKRHLKNHGVNPNE
jgi:acyl carrier protein|tara:strand:- start:326 stop:565 length:240 start_codon:yes stop_codon:yes gene_type:complete